jgi:hypothetical protein
MKNLLLLAAASMAISVANAQKYDRDNLEFNNTHLPSKLIYDQIKTFAYNVTVFGGDPAQLSVGDVAGMAYQFRSYDKADYSTADMKINYTVGPFAFVNEKTVSRQVDEEVNKVKTKVTKYKRVYEFKYPLRVEVINAKNSVRLLVNEYSAANLRSIESYEFNSESEAVAYFDKNKAEALRSDITGHVKNFVKGINSTTADQYDFYPAATVLSAYQFKKWDKADEYNKHVDHLKQVIKTMTAGENPYQAKEKLKDDIAYFQQFEGVFKPDDKKEDILFFGNYMNLATLYFCLDDMDKAQFYIAKLDSSDKKESTTKVFKSYIVSAQNRMAKHFLTTTHLDYNPVKDYRIAGKKFSSDALSAAENTVQGLGEEGIANANDVVKFANGNTLKGKVIYYAESNTLKLLPAHKPDSTVLLNAENTLSFNMDSSRYQSAKFKSGGTVVKQLLKVKYQSDKIILLNFLNPNLTEQDLVGTIRPGEELVTIWSGLGLKKSLGNYFEDCAEVAKKAKDGAYGSAMNTEVNKYIQMCTDYTNACGNKTAAIDK